MKKIDKKTFKRISERCLEMAHVTDNELLMKIDQFHAKISQGEELNSSSYTTLLDNKITDYLFSTYRSIEVTDDEKIVGSKGDEYVELFDARDTKIHLEI